MSQRPLKVRTPSHPLLLKVNDLSGFKLGDRIPISLPGFPGNSPVVPQKQPPGYKLPSEEMIQNRLSSEQEPMSNECARCKWEYKRNHGKGEEHLDSLGQDGWELCAVVQRATGELWIFKRPIK